MEVSETVCEERKVREVESEGVYGQDMFNPVDQSTEGTCLRM